MGKKGSTKKATTAIFRSQPVTLREQSTGKRHTNVNAKSMLKLEHIKNLAHWVSGEASIPSLAAFFGHRLAASAEAVGAPPDLSLFTCQRCESILQPGYNCTVRIEKNRRKVRSRCKKSTTVPQNNVFYTCHFCSHRNLLRGTQKGHMKEICPSKAKAPPKRDHIKAIAHKSVSSIRRHVDKVEIIKIDNVAPSDTLKDDSVASTPAAASVTPTLTLLESKMKKRNRSSAKKRVESEMASAAVDVSTSNKRRKKSWTSLKEIAEGTGNDGKRKFTNYPFLFVG